MKKFLFTLALCLFSMMGFGQIYNISKSTDLLTGETDSTSVTISIYQDKFGSITFGPLEFSIVEITYPVYWKTIYKVQRGNLTGVFVVTENERTKKCVIYFYTTMLTTPKNISMQLEGTYK